MPTLIASPTRIASVGNLPKFADEFIGFTNTGESQVSISRVHSPAGWEGLWQYADYREYRLVLKGLLRVENGDNVIEVEAGQALEVAPDEWVKYSTPDHADYVTVCLPAFSRATVHRQE